MNDLRRAVEGPAPRGFGPFSASDVEAYATASADDNPLHTDPSIAEKAGLARPPIHGMLLMGCFEPFLADWRPDATILKTSAKFIRPVLVGESVEMTGKVVQTLPDGTIVLRIMVRRGGELVCLAEAFARP